ncbi:MAG: hypothetical protein HN348_36785, partial [Proteobacteria bacterium]|nr:hypothetical protein [Pseudomonadota bacterium]
IRVIREATVDLDDLPDLDTSRLIYGGQSQGALVGAMAAGVETEIAAYALNGIGGYLSITVVERKDPVDINQQLTFLLGLDKALDRFHPVVALAQLGSDVTDPLSYAQRWRGWTEHPGGNNILLINGRNDTTTPTRSVNSITIAGDVTPVDQGGWDVDTFDLWDVEAQSLPISGNTSAVNGDKLTIATILDAKEGHYTIYNNEWARQLAVSFWTTGATSVPEIAEP